MLGLTLWLGFWQLQRLEWKTSLLLQIERGEAEAAVPLSASPRPFERVKAIGRFLPLGGQYGAEVRVETAGPVMGTHRLGILERPEGLPVLIDRGWAPEDAPAPLPRDQVVIEGYVRPAEHAFWFGPRDDQVGRRFYTLDPLPIGRAFGIAQIEPFTLVAMGPPDGRPEPVQSMPRPPNDHLSYAITWFALSAALTIVFALFVKQTITGGSKS